MKFLLTLLSAVMIISAVPKITEAQPTLSTLYGNPPNQYTSLDTNLNAVTNSKIFKFTDVAMGVLTFQEHIAKISGTVAGTIKLYASINGGTSWYLVTSYTLTDATQDWGYSVTMNPNTYYKLEVATTGTQQSSCQAWTFYRPYPGK